VTQNMPEIQTESKRHVPLEGQVNFRDLGGYQTTDGRTVRWRQLFRSGRLANLTDKDVTRLESLGIRTVVTLLTADDIEVYGPDRLPPGAKLLSLPIDIDAATELANRATKALKSGDFSQIPAELNPEIHRLLIHDGRDQYAALLREIVNPANRPLVFHCSHGVHRTGTGAAILLSALGIPWADVRNDYLLSNVYRREEVNKRLGQLRQMAAEKRGIQPGQVDMRNMEAFLIQQGAYIDASCDEMVRQYGTVDVYLRDGLGLDEQEIGQLRDELLD